MDDKEKSARVEVYQRSRRRWERVRQQAEERWPGKELPDSLFDIESLLHRIPALPSRLPAQKTVTGFATWKNMDAGCSLRERREAEQHLSLRYWDTRCRPSTSGAFDQWGQCSNNGLALLILGWAYVLNASLVERQAEQLSFMLVPRYAVTKERVPSQERGPPPFSIRVPGASADERAWWASLLRRGGVYKVAADKGRDSYLPWSLIVEEDWNVRVVDAASVPQMLPTAEQAACYIHKFAASFELGNQCTAALCAALTIPFQTINNLRDRVIELPCLSLASPSLPSAEEAALSCDPPPEFQQLSYLMTMSMAPHAVEDVLKSVFWEPGVTSRLAGASMLGMRHALRPLIEWRDHMALAKILSFTDAGPLWLGSLLCGRGDLMSLVLDKLQPGARHVPDVTAWTGVVLSFLQVRPGGPAVTAADDDDPFVSVCRADVWRLRQECCDAYEGDEAKRYRNGPSHGWGPDGEMRLKDVDLELRGHMRCHHLWSYQHWTWHCGGAVDAGFRSASEASHWLQRGDPGLAQSTTTAMDDAVTLTEEDGKAMDFLGDTARLELVHWCPDQVEGDWLAGLGDEWPLKKVDFGEPPGKSAPLKLSPDKRKFVDNWRDEVISLPLEKGVEASADGLWESSGLGVSIVRPECVDFPHMPESMASVLSCDQ